MLSQRVELARNLLMKTDMPLADVAQACGFADQSHFTRIFSAATGLPRGLAPRDWQCRFLSDLLKKAHRCRAGW
ncbi:helix-turn-helix domain-containing protein [Tardiphaga sp. 37S4]|uniref:helix-turn-helix domain-containing protein n=1 Tax=Tardiphaga sp. 37S4 TaxID=1404741 RepID=UPI0032E45706